MTITPSTMPILLIACGIANTPAPTIVFTRLMTDEIQDAEPAMPFSFLCLLRAEEACDAGREPCSLGTEFIAA